MPALPEASYSRRVWFAGRCPLRQQTTILGLTIARPQCSPERILVKLVLPITFSPVAVTSGGKALRSLKITHQSMVPNSQGLEPRRIPAGVQIGTVLVPLLAVSSRRYSSRITLSEGRTSQRRVRRTIISKTPTPRDGSVLERLLLGDRTLLRPMTGTVPQETTGNSVSLRRGKVLVETDRHPCRWLRLWCSSAVDRTRLTTSAVSINNPHSRLMANLITTGPATISSPLLTGPTITRAQVLSTAGLTSASNLVRVLTSRAIAGPVKALGRRHIAVQKADLITSRTRILVAVAPQDPVLGVTTADHAVTADPATNFT